MSLILAGMYVLGEFTRASCISGVQRGEVNFFFGVLETTFWV